MRKPSLIAVSLLALAACSPEIPDSGASAARSAPEATPQRDATSTAAAVLGVAGPSAQAAGQVVTGQVVTGQGATGQSATGQGATGQGATGQGATGQGATGQPAVTGAPVSAMGADAATAGIPADPAAAMSDEQNFQAVSARETIASDAERIEANRAQYVVIEPTQLPPRPDGTGASIVAYALATTNVPGQTLYRRAGIALQARFERNCAKYASPDLAQEAFLDAGGPKRDRHSLDPDGDGFACYWDPRPFRAARGGAPAVVDQYEVIETPGES